MCEGAASTKLIFGHPKGITETRKATINEIVRVMKVVKTVVREMILSFLISVDASNEMN
jgi:hypothetical protein